MLVMLQLFILFFKVNVPLQGPQDKLWEHNLTASIGVDPAELALQVITGLTPLKMDNIIHYFVSLKLTKYFLQDILHIIREKFFFWYLPIIARIQTIR